MNKNYTWHKLAESLVELRIPACGIVEKEVAGKKVCIILFNEQLYGCAARCPHAGGTLSEGYTDAFGNIVCPVHRYKFGLQHGRNTSGEGYHLKMHKVEKRADGIYIGFETSWLRG
ncbi:MAG: Rieske 2Fe-2S domain-containing protein [Ferruginibacter sp.]